MNILIRSPFQWCRQQYPGWQGHGSPLDFRRPPLAKNRGNKQSLLVLIEKYTFFGPLQKCYHLPAHTCRGWRRQWHSNNPGTTTNYFREADLRMVFQSKKSITSRSSQVTDMIRSGPGASGTLQDWVSVNLIQWHTSGGTWWWHCSLIWAAGCCNPSCQWRRLPSWRGSTGASQTCQHHQIPETGRVDNPSQIARLYIGHLLDSHIAIPIIGLSWHCAHRANGLICKAGVSIHRVSYTNSPKKIPKIGIQYMR